MTWGGYAPQEVIDLFEAETGHTVEVTTSNNEEMIEKLRATNGGGFDLAAIDNIKWYPPVPAGLEALEGATLDRINAAN